MEHLSDIQVMEVAEAIFLCSVFGRESEVHQQEHVGSDTVNYETEPEVSDTVHFSLYHITAVSTMIPYSIN